MFHHMSTGRKHISHGGIAGANFGTTTPGTLWNICMPAPSVISKTLGVIDKHQTSGNQCIWQVIYYFPTFWYPIFSSKIILFVYPLHWPLFGGCPIIPSLVHQPAYPSIWPAAPSLQRGLHKSRGDSVVRMWVKLKRWCLLQRGHSGDGCDLASTLCKYDLGNGVRQGCDE